MSLPQKALDWMEACRLEYQAYSTTTTTTITCRHFWCWPKIVSGLWLFTVHLVLFSQFKHLNLLPTCFSSNTSTIRVLCKLAKCCHTAATILPSEGGWWQQFKLMPNLAGVTTIYYTPNQKIYIFLDFVTEIWSWFLDLKKLFKICTCKNFGFKRCSQVCKFKCYFLFFWRGSIQTAP